MQTARFDLTEQNGFEMHVGESPYRAIFEFAAEDGTPWDFTGCSAKSEIRDKRQNLLAEFDVELGANGRVDLVLDDPGVLLPTRNAVYDLAITFANGDRYYPVAGAITIVDRVTEL